MLPGRFRGRHLAARTVLRVGTPVQSLAALAVGDRWALVAASLRGTVCVDDSGEVLGTRDFTDNVTDLAVSGRTVVIGTGEGIYAWEPLD